MCAPRKIVVGWRRAQGPGGRGNGGSRENRRAAICPTRATAVAPGGAIGQTQAGPADSCAAYRRKRRDPWPNGLGISGPEDLRWSGDALVSQTLRGKPPSSKTQAPEKLQVPNIKPPGIARTPTSYEA